MPPIRSKPGPKPGTKRTPRNHKKFNLFEVKDGVHLKFVAEIAGVTGDHALLLAGRDGTATPDVDYVTLAPRNIVPKQVQAAEPRQPAFKIVRGRAKGSKKAPPRQAVMEVIDTTQAPPIERKKPGPKPGTPRPPRKGTTSTKAKASTKTSTKRAGTKAAPSTKASTKAPSPPKAPQPTVPPSVPPPPPPPPPVPTPPAPSNPFAD